MVNRKVSEPVQDALKAYLELALGLTEASRKKAEKAVKKMAKELVGKGNATASQIQTAVEDLVATSASNREAVTRLVRVEMDRAMGRIGFATSEEVATLQARLDAMERQLRDEQAAAPKTSAPQASTTKPSTTKPPTTKTTTPKTTTPTATTTKATTTKTSPTKSSTPGKAASRPAASRKATVVQTAPVVKKEPTVKAAASTSSPDVPVAPKKVPPKKAVKKTAKKAVPVTEATP
ncbi:MAG TPA: hypothetical protein VF062_01725, partial [Candidatus Limnocylindrales bacterium]